MPNKYNHTFDLFEGKLKIQYKKTEGGFKILHGDTSEEYCSHLIPSKEHLLENLQANVPCISCCNPGEKQLQIGSNLTNNPTERFSDFNPPTIGDTESEPQRAVNLISTLKARKTKLDERDWKSEQTDLLSKAETFAFILKNETVFKNFHDYMDKQYKANFPDDVQRTKLYFFTNKSYPHDYVNPDKDFQ